jgi:hypothetical protein
MARKIADEPGANLSAESWDAQEPCKYCGGRPGYNPATGIWIRAWDAATHEYIEGHRAGCDRPQERK